MTCRPARVLRNSSTSPVSRHDGGVIVVDAANVVGSRPNGWWRDRAGAAAKLCRGILDALADGRLEAPVTVVLEGAARRGVAEGDDGGVAVVHAAGSGDDSITDVVSALRADSQPVRVVTADRGLRDQVEHLGADVVGPTWLLERLEAAAEQ